MNGERQLGIGVLDERYAVGHSAGLDKHRYRAFRTGRSQVSVMGPSGVVFVAQALGNLPEAWVLALRKVSEFEVTE